MRRAGPATTCRCCADLLLPPDVEPVPRVLARIATRCRTPRRIADRHEAMCVIGAGGSGLAALKNLREQGFAVDCYERETSVGGAWNWRHDRSPVYASTQLVSSRPLSEFPDFPMPDTWPDYPHHSRSWPTWSGTRSTSACGEHIWFGTEVVAVRPVGDGRWDVTTRSTGGGVERIQRYAAVVVANGHNWAPKPPEVRRAGTFRGQLIHASAYKDPAQLRGRPVLVVGGGNTGCDLAVEAAQQATTVWHSTRRGYHYAPEVRLRPPRRPGQRSDPEVAAAAVGPPVDLPPGGDPVDHRGRPGGAA